jgi:hypothetical protein
VAGKPENNEKEMKMNKHISAKELHEQNVKTRFTVHVPASLWAGKTPEMARDVLKNRFAPEVIAVVLEQLSDNRTECGRLLSQDEIDKGIERESGTYQRRFDSFLAQAKIKYFFNFNG